ncbi:MAG TPA: hypothetical protein VMS31_12075 [Pyrinomonadaceae bacterium]|nr:hypothetical protein [Pyrinomonadaceae bacterium]
MTRKTLLAVGAGITVVISGVAAALINELHNGRWWWVAAGAALLLWALIAAWLVRKADSPSPVRQGAGSVYTGGKIKGGVTTDVTINGSGPATPPSDGDVIGDGAVRAQADIEGNVSTTARLNRKPPTP